VFTWTPGFRRPEQFDSGHEFMQAPSQYCL